MEPRRVLLAYMPFGLIQTASLGLSLLKAQLTRRGIACDVRYFNLEFADACFDGTGDMRSGLYARLTHRFQLAFTAEAQVAELLYGHDPARAALIAHHLAGALPDERAFLATLRDRFERFLKTCMESVDWRRYHVLGLGSTFVGMTMPSVLLAREVKRQFPHVATVLGGPNTEGAMGEVMARRFTDIDYILRGEADETWPVLVDALLAGRAPGPLPGLVYRAGDGVSASPARPVARMDDLPYPDFDDFIGTAARTAFRSRYDARLQLPFESSRGCWWGEKSHCKFCGINSLGMGYRSKSHDRLVDEIDWLARRYRPHMLLAADAILDTGYFGTLLPRLAARATPIALSYEVKANLTRPQMLELRQAGVTEIMPGLETFSTRLLKLMKKGSSSFDNLLCLRLAEEYGIKVSWFHMCGLPGESMEDYRRNIATIRTIPHLHPPREIARFTLQRFTPYLDRAEAEGIGRIRPLAEYRAVFPWSDEDLRDVAYHFEFDFADGRDSALTGDIELLLDAAVAEWKARYGQVALDLVLAENGALIVDTRAAEALVHVLDSPAAWLYNELDRPHTLETLSCRPAVPLPRTGDDGGAGPSPIAPALWEEAQSLAGSLAATLVTIRGPRVPRDADERRWAEDVRSWLNDMSARGLVYSEGSRFLALALPRSREWFTSRYLRHAASGVSS